MLTGLLWLAVTVIFGLVQGSFTVPMKYATKTWKWEHTWGIWSVWALLILPWIIAYSSVPDLLTVYKAVPLSTMLVVFVVGLGWGIGAITFGMGVHYVGIALGFAIIMGLTTALGSLIPLFMHPADVLTPTGLSIIAGVMLMMVGIVISARAGILKDKILSGTGNPQNPSGRKSFVKGLIICIVAGVCGSWLNISFVLGAPIQEQAVTLGANPTYAPNAVWCISLLGGAIVNLSYCFYLIWKNKSWSLFSARKMQINWFYTFSMGVMWMGSFAMYGICTAKLGELGPAMGFAVFLGMAIVTGNLWGVLTGEWKAVGSKPILIMSVGVVFLLAGMGVIGWGNTLKGSNSAAKTGNARTSRAYEGFSLIKQADTGTSQTKLTSPT